jgi:hypothetical protein
LQAIVAVSLLLDIVTAGVSGGARMGVRDKLRAIGNYVRTRWRSTDPDSYQQYRAERERERKQEEQRREHTERSSERELEGAAREREYDERYAAERAAEERERIARRRDTSQPE